MTVETDGCVVIGGFHPGEPGIGIATLQPFDEAPMRIATCGILAEDLESTVASMRVELIEATDEDFAPSKVQVSIRVEGE